MSKTFSFRMCDIFICRNIFLLSFFYTKLFNPKRVGGGYSDHILTFPGVKRGPQKFGPDRFSRFYLWIQTDRQTKYIYRSQSCFKQWSLPDILISRRRWGGASHYQVKKWPNSFQLKKLSMVYIPSEPFHLNCRLSPSFILWYVCKL